MEDSNQHRSNWRRNKSNQKSQLEPSSSEVKSTYFISGLFTGGIATCVALNLIEPSLQEYSHMRDIYSTCLDPSLGESVALIGGFSIIGLGAYHAIRYAVKKPSKK